MEDLHKSIGKKITFISMKNKQNVQAVLVGANKDHVQVKLLQPIRAETRTWSIGDIRLFDMDKINNIKISNLNEVPTEPAPTYHQLYGEIGMKTRKRGISASTEQGGVKKRTRGPNKPKGRVDLPTAFDIPGKTTHYKSE